MAQDVILNGAVSENAEMVVIGDPIAGTTTGPGNYFTHGQAQGRINITATSTSKMGDETGIKVKVGDSGRELIILRADSQPLTLSVYSLDGVTMASFTLTQTVEAVNLAYLPKAIYIVGITNDSAILATLKINIQ